MKKSFLLLFLAALSVLSVVADEPWQHGPLRVSDNGAYFAHADNTPFFWMGDTGWLLPQKMNRNEVSGYLDHVADAGYNVVQVQTLNDVPSINIYGQKSHIDGWDFSNIDNTQNYGYWDHMDYIIDQARQRGIYVAMVCIWGGLVKGGKMDAEQARAYGDFLARRYGNCPNIVWVIGGDIRGDVKTEVWAALADAIKSQDTEHLMSFHPFGRTSSAYWWHDSDWLDFDMFQSGHRRYDQTRGDGDDRAAASVAEDNWRYVEHAIGLSPRKPVIDAEPSYEDIPHGLHDINEPRWQADDVRRYAYWSVFAGAAGHTYGHNSVMQMLHPGDSPAYGATKPWYVAVHDDGYNQMKHLKNLMLAFPYLERVPDQSIILDGNGSHHDYVVACRGNDYLMAYTYTNSPISVNLTKIAGDKKRVWWYDPRSGASELVGVFDNVSIKMKHDGPSGDGYDWVLVAADASAYHDFPVAE